MKKKVLIIGAGPSGLGAAYNLLKKSNDYEVLIIEKEKEIGGLCKTENFKNIKLDYGVHFYRISEYQEFNDIVYNLLPIEDMPSKNLTEKERKKYIKDNINQNNSDNVMLINSSSSNIYFDNQFYEYPIKINFDTLKKMGIVNLIKIGFSYLKVLIKKKPEINLENYYINRYGRKFYEMFFLEYTIKVCGVHPKDIDIDWGKQRIRETSLINILKEKIFKNKKVENEPSLIEEYYYPKYGCGEIYKHLALEVEKMGGQILTNSYIKKINIKNFKIEQVEYINNRNKKEIKPDYIISSMPLKDFASILKGDNLDKNVINNIKELPFRDLILVNILLEKKEMEKLAVYNTIKENSWVFIQDPKIKFGRIKIANNWSKYMFDEKTYKDKVLLTLEYCCDNSDPFCKLNNEEIIKIVKKELKILNLYPKKILDYKIDKIKNAYPAYYGTYKKRNEIIKYLNCFKQLYFVGRAGQHQYIDMDKAIYTGLKASENIIRGKNNRNDVWL